MKKLFKLLAVGMACAVMAFAFAFTGCSSGGDGVTTCKNCGKKEVVALGFCRRCYRSFHDYTYPD